MRCQSLKNASKDVPLQKESLRNLQHEALASWAEPSRARVPCYTDAGAMDGQKTEKRRRSSLFWHTAFPPARTKGTYCCYYRLTRWKMCEQQRAEQHDAPEILVPGADFWGFFSFVHVCAPLFFPHQNGNPLQVWCSSWYVLAWEANFNTRPEMSPMAAADYERQLKNMRSKLGMQFEVPLLFQGITTQKPFRPCSFVQWSNICTLLNSPHTKKVKKKNTGALEQGST